VQAAEEPAVAASNAAWKVLSCVKSVQGNVA
jgi:hypothetical protein